MSISKTPPTESHPSHDQLDKIVDSLGLLIQMQSERDERVEFTLNRLIRNQETLESKIEKLAVGSSEPYQEDETAAIFAKYGIGPDNQSEEESAETDSPAQPNVEQAVESSPEEPTVESESVDLTDREIPPMDREEIEELKEQLRETLREAEIEFAVRRARLSHREAIIEEKEERFKREAKRSSILQDVDESNSSNTMLNRLKLHLREFTADKMARQKEDQAKDDDKPEA